MPRTTRNLVCDMSASRTYQIRTYGCQMNMHDSERLAGLLEEAGLPAARRTASRRRRRLQHLRGPGERRQPAVRQPRSPAAGQEGAARHADRGGRVPGPEGPGGITDRAPWVDVVFGTHNIGSLPVAAGTRPGRRSRPRSRSSSRSSGSRRCCPPGASPATRPGWRSRSAATTPARSASCPACAAARRTAGQATCWPRSRRWSPTGVLEVTLLGQNVNSYGVGFGDRLAFGKLLRACGEIDGLERVRFTSPHPRDFTDDVIAAMAETPNVMPQLHMPLQSGSDAVLRADAPGLPPGHLPGDPGQGARRRCRTPRSPPTSSWASRARPSRTSPTPWTSSGRPGSPAPSPSSTPCGRAPRPRPWTTRSRPRSSPSGTSGWSPWSRRSSLAENQALAGREVEVLVAEGEGRKDGATHRMSGRARDNRLVHFAPRPAPPRGPATS